MVSSNTILCSLQNFLVRIKYVGRKTYCRRYYSYLLITRYELKMAVAFSYFAWFALIQDPKAEPEKWWGEQHATRNNKYEKLEYLRS